MNKYGSILKIDLKINAFDTMENLKQWLHMMVNQMKAETIKSITGNHHYVDAFMTTFKI